MRGSAVKSEQKLIQGNKSEHECPTNVNTVENPISEETFVVKCRVLLDTVASQRSDIYVLKVRLL